MFKLFFPKIKGFSLPMQIINKKYFVYKILNYFLKLKTFYLITDKLLTTAHRFQLCYNLKKF